MESGARRFVDEALGMVVQSNGAAVLFTDTRLLVAGDAEVLEGVAARAALGIQRGVDSVAEIVARRVERHGADHGVVARLTGGG